MVARDDLAGGESHDAWVTGQNGASTRNPLGLLGSKGARPGVVAVAVRPSPVWGAATPARRWCWRLFPVRGHANTCAMACARQLAHARETP
jgi:hypothetical protein